MTRKQKYLRAVRELEGTDDTATGGVTARQVADHLDVPVSSARTALTYLHEQGRVHRQPDYSTETGQTSTYATLQFERRGQVQYP